MHSTTWLESYHHNDAHYDHAHAHDNDHDRHYVYTTQHDAAPMVSAHSNQHVHQQQQHVHGHQHHQYQDSHAYYPSASSSAPPVQASYSNDDYIRTYLPHSLSPTHSTLNTHNQHSYSSSSSFPTLSYNHPPTRYVDSPLPSPVYHHDVYEDAPAPSHPASYDHAPHHHHSHSHSHSHSYDQQVSSSASYNSHPYSTSIQSPYSPSRGHAAARQEDPSPHSVMPQSPMTVNPIQYHESRTSTATPRFAPASYSQSAIVSPLSTPSSAVRPNVSNTRSHYADDSEDEVSDDSGGRTDAYAALRAAASGSARASTSKASSSPTRGANAGPFVPRIKYENEGRTIYNAIPIVSRRTRNSLSAASNAILDYYPHRSPHNNGYSSPQHSPTGNSTSTNSSFATDLSLTRPPSYHSSPPTSESEADMEYVPARVARVLPAHSKVGNPVPIPNLTKKSRGRHVPTTPFVLQNGISKNIRLHTCTVEGCGKCFARGEHLKRHIRSIHTNDKPYKCMVSGCGKSFSRHDNLNQHTRIHKNYSAPKDGGF